MNIFLVHHRSPHHAENSGYGRLIDYMDGQVVYGQTKFSYRVAKFLAKRHSQNGGNYNAGSILKTIELYRLLKKSKDQKNIVHFLNGERDIRHLGFLKKRFPNTVFCATFHKPPQILKDTITNVSALHQLDGAIAVGDNQVEFLKEWLDLEVVAYIPHGVDTQFFKPDVSKKKKNNLLFVGQHLRDFETFNKIVPKLADEIPDLHINVVIHPAYASKIQRHDCISIFTGVKDVQLRTLYQEATALFLPMLDSTACNSILEALACGLPIVTSNVGENAMYLKNTTNILIGKWKTETSTTKITNLLMNQEHLLEMGKTSREKALELDWSKVANDIHRFYEKLSK